MKKARAIIALVLNVLIIAVVGVAIANRIFAFLPGSEAVDPANIGPAVLNLAKFYVVDANAFLAVVAILCLIGNITVLAGRKPNKFLAIIKLAGAVGSLAALAGVLGYCIPFGELRGWTWNSIIDWHWGLLMVLVVPVLGLASAIVENKPKLGWPWAFMGLLVPACFGIANYVLAMLTVNMPELGWFDFYYAFQFGTVKSWVLLAAMAVGSFLLAYCIVMVRRIEAAEKFDPAVLQAANLADEAKPAEEVAPVAEPAPKAKPEPQPKAAPAPEPKPVVVAPAPAPEPAPEPVEQPAEEPAPEAEPAPAKKVLAPRRDGVRPAVPTGRGGPRVYHITKRPNGFWSVKLANSDKIIKLFDTQAEAIAYARGLVESRGGSVRIHSVSGRIRKG